MAMEPKTGSIDEDIFKPDNKFSESQIKENSKKANQLFDQMFDEVMAQSPMALAIFGIDEKNDQLDSFTEEHGLAELELYKKWWDKIEKEVNFSALDKQTRLSYLVVKKIRDEKIDSWEYRFNHYYFNQMYGMQSELPTFMMNVHQVKNEQAANDYISRLSQFKRVIDEIIAQSKNAESKGVISPAFVYPRIIPASENIIKGTPFDRSGKDSPLWADFKTKVEKLNLSEKKSKDLFDRAERQMQLSVLPAYRTLVSFLKDQQKRAKKTNGVWALPNGEKFYDYQLKHHTTLKNVTANQIHELGLKEVSRIHEEIKAVMAKVKFKGGIKDFFKYVTEDEQFYYPQTEEGQKSYLKKSEEYVAAITSALDKLFITKPKRSLEVRAVEKFREDSAGSAFYEGPPLKGDRPGIYYANLKDMKSLPKWEMEALVHHETIPGHHMQISIQSDLLDLPKVRRTTHFTAYVEGWGLYSEKIPKEIGFYKDPYSDFGRLAMELVRATRLVVDTGIHSKKWSMEKATKYLDDNMPGPHADHLDQIQRYFVMPGQATAYKVGMNKILELREQSIRELGREFSPREFHEQILTNGPLPLDILEKVILKYQNEKLKRS